MLTKPHAGRFRFMCLTTLFSMLIFTPRAALSQESAFTGGVVKQGNLEAEFSPRGVLMNIRYDGESLFAQHPGGVSTSGHDEERWTPWVSQASEYRGDVKMTLTETGDSAVILLRGSMSPKDIEGVSTYEVTTTLREGRISQSAKMSTMVKGLWNRFGTSLILDPELFAWTCYRGDDQPWKIIPGLPEGRNLIPSSQTAASVDLVNEAWVLRFEWDGPRTPFFDDRTKKWQNFKFEFGMPQQEVTDERGQKRYEAQYNLAVDIARNTEGKTPLAIPRRASAPVETAVLNLADPERQLEAPAKRHRYSLDGTWKIQPVGVKEDFPQTLSSYPPPAGVWSDVTVPHPKYPTDGWAGPEHAAWFNTEFTPPATLSKDQTFVLHFEEISYWCNFYLNGQKVGEHFGGYVPVNMDVTRYLRHGVPNTLEIFVGDPTAGLDPTRFPEGAPASTSTNAMKTPDSIIAPVYSARRGILQSVYLEARPRLSVENTFVKTSVREGRIEVETTVANDTRLIQTVLVENQVLDQGKTVRTLPAVSVSIPPRGSMTVQQGIDWADARLWDVGQPNLYQMETTVVQDEQALDTVDTRFGFREFWIEGPNFILNGKPIRLREASTHVYFHVGRVDWDERYKNDPIGGARAEIKAVQEANFNATRMVHRPHPRYFYDICDELGHLAISHMPFGFHKNQFQLDNPVLVAHSARLVSAQVRKERNHPSLIMWEAENEGFPHGVGDEAFRMAEFYNQGVIEPIRRLDPTRPIKGGGDGDLMDRADVFDMHGGDWPALEDVPLPNSNWQLLERPSTRMYGYVDGPRWRWDRSKPLYIGEGLYWMFADNKDQAARFIGEAVFEDPQLGDQWTHGQEQFLEVAQAAYWRIGLPVWRMLGELAGYCPWSVAPGFGVTLTMPDRPVISAARETLKPERFFIKELYRHFYAKAPVRLDLCLVNDSRDQQVYQVEWRVEQEGRRIAGETFKSTLDPAATAWQVLSFDAPDLREKQTVQLIISMSRAGEVVHEETVALQIYPRTKTVVSKNLVPVLIDPEGRTATALDLQGIHYTRAANTEAALGLKPAAIIFGEDALMEDSHLPLTLDEYVRDGGRVLMLAQQTMKVYGPMARADDEQRRTRSLVFPSDITHPLLAGITADELQFWNHSDWDQAHAVARHSRLKFTQGAVFPVLECDSLWFAPLQEVHFGKGLYIEASLDLVRKMADEPVVAKFWENILTRLATYEAQPAQSLSVLRDDEMVAHLRAQGVVSELVEIIPTQGFLMITSASGLASTDRDAVQGLLSAGGTVWMHARGEVDTAAWAAVTGWSIETRPHSRDFRNREVRRTAAGRAAGPLTGISSVALYERNSVDDLWTVTGPEVSELASGGAVVYAPVASGKILLDRLAWDSPKGLAHRQWAEHYLHALAAALGVDVDLYRYVARRQYRAEDFVPVDFRAEVNRGFRDEVADDREGGWTDQGPNNDLRGMQIGQRVFHQIVFDIIDPLKNDGKSCLVLYSPTHAPTGIRKTGEISVNEKADALFFLQTAAWYSSRTHLGAPLIRYVVTYEDGSLETAEALGGLHIRDWWSPGDAQEARGVSLLLRSETEPDALPRRRGLQLQEWTNPHPEKTIRSLRVESANTGIIPIVVAISTWREKK